MAHATQRVAELTAQLEDMEKKLRQQEKEYRELKHNHEVLQSQHESALSTGAKLRQKSRSLKSLARLASASGILAAGATNSQAGSEEKQGNNLPPNAESHMKQAVQLSRTAMKKGNHPFGALLVDPQTNKVVLTAENTVHSGQKYTDVTNHAELNLMRAVQSQPKLMKRIGELVMYTSTEPCAMCSGAVWWTGVRSIVFGCSEKRLSEIVNQNPKLRGGGLNASSAAVLSRADAKVNIVGPLLEDEAASCHSEYWLKL